MKRSNKRETREKGITLLALVVAIIIIIILSAITINMAFGDNGLIKQTESAKLKYDEESSREQLEMVLAGLVADKKVKPEYDEQDYINKEIIKNNMQVTGDIVIVNGWQFLIDRSVPQIVSSLGKGINDESIVIEASSKTNSDRSKATITAIISCEEDITEVSMNGEMLQVPEKEEGKYTITKEVSKNGTYTMIARSENKYNMKNYEVQDIIPEISKIYTLDDLKAFRESVNLGRSYAGKTIELMNDIDLQGSEENQWETIGDYEANTNNGFDGIFEGNNHTISNLYINKPNKNFIGLFSFIKTNAEVRNIIIEGKITGNSWAGGVAGANFGNINSCINKVTLDIKGECARRNCTVGQDMMDISLNVLIMVIFLQSKVLLGMVGWSEGRVDYCYNMANITVTGTDSAGSANLGGVVGGTGNSSSSIKNCYNTGTIKSSISGTSIGGITGCLGWNGSWTLSNCINVGQSYNNNHQLPTVDFGNNTRSFGRVVGYNDSNDKITNSISITEEQLKNYTNEELKNKLGEEFVRDESNINNGYPILKWQLEK